MVSLRRLWLICLQVFLLGFCLIAGYFAAGWWAGTREATLLAQICAQVDYVNSLQRDLEGQQTISKEVRYEFNVLVDQCRVARRDRVDELD
jgi:hypothetical protein